MNPARRVKAREVTEWDNKDASERSQRANEKRKASGRRRRVDPTTCDRDYTPAEIRFMNAMQEYKQSSGRMFPTWTEVLEVLTGLGYTEPKAPKVPKASLEAG